MQRRWTMRWTTHVVRYSLKHETAHVINVRVCVCVCVTLVTVIACSYIYINRLAHILRCPGHTAGGLRARGKAELHWCKLDLPWLDERAL